MIPNTNEKNLIEQHDINQISPLNKTQNPCVIWFTGLSGSGKSTLAHALQQELNKQAKVSIILDGDNVRKGLNNDLGFSSKDRKENIRRVAEVSKLFTQAGLITITSFISPFTEDRTLSRNIISPYPFIEIYLNTSLENCEKRDPKGQYKKARANIITEFTGISSPYEEPTTPDIILDTATLSIEHCINHILKFLEQKKFIAK